MCDASHQVYFSNPILSNVFLILIPILSIVEKMMGKYKDLRLMNLRNFLRAHQAYQKKIVSIFEDDQAL
jgi:hypothetical protein